MGATEVVLYAMLAIVMVPCLARWGIKLIDRNLNKIVRELHEITEEFPELRNKVNCELAELRKKHGL